MLDNGRPFRDRWKRRLRSVYESKVWGQCGTGCCILLIFVGFYAAMFAWNYYDAYQNVFPGSLPAYNINKNSSTGNAFEAWKGIITFITLPITAPIFFMLWWELAKAMNRGVGACFACVPSTILLPVFLVWGTWQFWLSWAMAPVWTHFVYLHACEKGGWQITATLQGADYGNEGMPQVGTALVVMEHGNYTMQLQRADTSTSWNYTFYLLESANATPVFSQIYYNVVDNSYAVNGSLDNFILNPNLELSSLGLTLANPQIPFDSNYGPPNANLVKHVNSTETLNVLDTVTTSANDCTSLKVCGMEHPDGDFEIAMGIVLIYQYYYAVSCTTPSSSSD